MVIESEQKLKTIINEQKMPNIILLFGDEMALVSSCVNKCCSYFSTEKQNFDGANLDVDEIAEASQIVGFFSENRVFFIRELESNYFDSIKEITKDFSESSVLVMTLSPSLIEKKKGKSSILCVKNKATTEFINYIDKIGMVVVLDKPEEQTMASYIVEYCQNKDVKIDINNALFLIRHSGSSLLSLYNECDKLCFYISPRMEITKEDIAICCPSVLEDAIFDIQKAMLLGNEKRVFKIVEDLIKQKNPPTKILAILEGNFAQTYKIVLAKNSGLSSDEIAKKLKENRSWIIKNALSDASKISIGRLYRVCTILLENDINLKSKKVDEQICLENTLSLCMLALKGEKV